MKKKTYVIAALAVLLSLSARAQTPSDGFLMNKGTLCTVLGYSQSTWTHYWEGTRYRNNLNIGTFKSQSLIPMLAYGVTNKLNVFAATPWIKNSSSAGTMMGKKGWQDFSFDAKYQVAHFNKKQWSFDIFGSAGFSLPATNYPPDFLPYSIGLGSKTLTGRVVVHTLYKQSFFVTAQAAYTAKSNITVNRVTYYNDGQRYSNQMPVPNMWSGAIAAGYNNKLVRTDIYYRFGNSETGNDIRRNDMPLPTNKMNSQSIGFNGQLWIPRLNHWGLIVSADHTIAGRNIGKAFTWMAGLQYFFTPFKKKQHATA